MIAKTIGWGFIFFGVLWGILDRFMCKGLCSVCTSQQLRPCFFLFLFVGIIFIVCGLSLISMQESQLPIVKLKKNKRRQNCKREI